MEQPAEPEAPLPAPASRPGRRLRRKPALILAAAVILAAGTAAAVVALTSGPSYPHPWCRAVLTQLHAHETQDQFDTNMAALESQGAPVAALISDGDTATQDQNAAGNSNFSGGFDASIEAMNAMANVGTDLKALNRACGQPADAYKNDIY